MWMASLSLPEKWPPCPPTAISVTMSPSRSPMATMDAPKLSKSLSSGPLAVLSDIVAVRLTPPSAFMNIMNTPPLAVPPPSSS